MLTDKPLRKILHKPKLSRRLVTWAVELGKFDIKYMLRTTIKDQALVVLFIEFGFANNYTKEEENPDRIGLGIRASIWTLYIDGSSTNDRPKSFVIQQALRLKFRATKNLAEYEALLVGIRLANKLELKRSLRACSDSQLVVRQFSGGYEESEPRITQYTTRVKNEVTKVEHSNSKE